MKKALFTTIALTAVLSLSSCGDNSTHTTEISGKDKPQTTTEAVTLADELTEVDVFENCEIHIDDAYEHCYPNNLYFFMTTITDENDVLKDKVDYKCTITGDCNKIVAEVMVDKEKCNEALKDDGLKIKSDSKTFEIDLNETKTQLIRKEQLSEEVINTLTEQINATWYNKPDKIYALLPKDETIFFKDFECNNSKHEIWETGQYGTPDIDNKLPESQIIGFVPYDEEHTQIIECNPQFKEGKLLDWYQCSDYRVKRDDGRYESKLSNAEVNDVFDSMISQLREEGYEFEVVEIPVTIE